MTGNVSELISALAEAALYGFLLSMFSGTAWTLWSQRSVYRENFKVIVAALLLLLLSTMHLVISIIQVIENFAAYPESHSGAAAGDMCSWMTMFNVFLLIIQMLLGDGIVLYRCYVVWQSKLVMILPVSLWLAVGVSGLGGALVASPKHRSAWITSFWTSALASNVSTTVLLAYRIWYVDRKATKTYGPGKTHLRSILSILISASLILFVVLSVTLICFLRGIDFPYGAMIMPIIPITFYMVIIRASLAHWTKLSRSINVQLEPTETDEGCPMQGHTTELTEKTLENGLSSVVVVESTENDGQEGKPEEVV